MKKYRLKKWYPSLDEKWDTTHRYEYQSSTGYMCNKSIQHCVIIYKKELHPDFWELIEEEEPLFITEDGVEIFLGHSYILIDKEFIKHKQTASNIVYTEYFKKFKHESNADEYIWRNKRVFSYNDVMELINLRLYTKETIEHDAKERSAE